MHWPTAAKSFLLYLEGADRKHANFKMSHNTKPKQMGKMTQNPSVDSSTRPGLGCSNEC